MKAHYQGHRQRLKQRFRHCGSDALADYELLEMLLYFVNARGDTKPIAKNLLQRFGHFMGLLEADEARLQEVESVGEKTSLLIKTVQAVLQRANRQRIIKKPIFTYQEEIILYLKHMQAYSIIEQLRLLFLNTRNELIHEELHQWGTIDHSPFYPREIIKRALELGASGVIVVHNHPNGEARPSKADINLTALLKEAGEHMRVEILDHIIIAKGEHFSFKQHQLV